MQRFVPARLTLVVFIACAVTVSTAASEQLNAGFDFSLSHPLQPTANPFDSPPGELVTGDICHDGIWADGEFCGRDAVLTTDPPTGSSFGVADMNHDCYSDALDFRLLGQSWLLSGPNISGDLNGDQTVGIHDLAVFVSTVAHPACPCNPSGMQPDQCAGQVALSFSPDPGNIVQEIAAAPGVLTVYILMDGFEDAALLEVPVVTSDNLTIFNHTIVTDLEGWGFFDPDSQHSYRVGVKVGDAVFPDAPIVFSELTVLVMDTEPAWIQIQPFPLMPYLATRARWSGREADHSVDFATVLNVGINGPAPAGVSTCGTIVDPPCGDNQGPICDAGEPQSGAVDSPITFNGAESIDPDGTIVSYDWEFGDGTTGTGALPMHVYTSAGLYMITLTVTDDGSATSSCTTTANIVDGEECPRISRFDAGNEDWAEEDPVEVSILWVSTDGNPGGFLKTLDESGGGAAILAPSKFLGDLSSLDGLGVVRLDHVLLDTNGQPIVGSPRVAFFGPGGAAMYDFGPPTIGEWSSHEIPLDESLWTITEGSWPDLMVDVQEMRLRADMTSGFDEHGFDNVYVGLPPEPEDDCNNNQIPDHCDTDTDGDGVPDDCEVVSVPPVTVAQVVGPVITRLENRPNPFNPTTTIVFELAATAEVELTIHDVVGRLVRTLIDPKTHGVRVHEVSWDGKNASGQPMPSGVYQYRLVAGATEKTARMVLLR